LSQKIYLDWNNDSLYWSAGPVDYIWSEVYIIIEVVSAVETGGYMPEEEPWDWLNKKLDKKVSDEFKRIMIRVNGLTKVKELGKDTKITVGHIKKTLDYFGFGNVVKVRLKDQDEDI